MELFDIDDLVIEIGGSELARDGWQVIQQAIGEEFQGEDVTIVNYGERDE